MWTWYLAVDFQLSLIAPFVIYFLRKYEKKMMIILVVSILLVSHGLVVTLQNNGINFAKHDL
jgi:peptidoglycan/LPS O-acetylase OafA/YrhL